MNLSFAEFQKLSRQGNLVAVFETIPADLDTPVSAFLKLAQKEPHAFLLESAEQAEQIGRYSFLGFRPSLVLQSTGEDGGVLDILKEKLGGLKLANAHELPGFCGGFVGFFSYENVEQFESICLKSKKGPKFPGAIFFFSDQFLIFDHFRKNLSVVCLIKIDRKSGLKNLYQSAQKRIITAINQLRKPLRQNAGKSKLKTIHPKSNMSPKEFQDKVNRIKKYIRAGDCIQVVLSQRFTLPAIQDDFQIYRSLRSINPSPYMFYFRSGKFRMIGSSPEMLVKKMGKTAEVRPIAGTRPRGETPVQDAALEENLKRSPKEMAEHLMLVDLGRNDLGRVCEFDSIRVKNFARVERYSHVMHLVSDVVGKLKPNKNAFDLLKATFPAGTVTGAPKIRAMQIINDLEPEGRGPYAGCLGYFSLNGDMDMCLTIRTLIANGRKLYLQAGAGVVKDSSPAREYQETVNKAKALLKAISLREKF